MLWSNSCHVQKLDLGKIEQSMRETAIPLAHVYVDKHGKKRCCGKKKVLKESQSLDKIISCSFMECARAIVCNIASQSKSPLHPRVRSYTKAFGYKLASLLPNMHEGVFGFRTAQDRSFGE